MFKKLFLVVILVMPLFPKTVHPMYTIDVKYGATPTIDGVFSPGEWSDADSAVISEGGGHHVKIYYKHSGTAFFLALNHTHNIWRDRHESRYGHALIFDVLHNHGNAPQPDDYRLRGDCGSGPIEFIGTGNEWQLVDSATGWSYVWGGGDFECVEFIVSYSKLGITAGIPKALGFMFNEGEGFLNGRWPDGSDYRIPSSWADMSSSDNWGTSGIEERVHSYLNKLELESHPNPFGGETHIAFSILHLAKNEIQNANYSLKIYDLTGRLVRTFPISNSISWDGSDDSGKLLPSGIYFCQLQADDESITKRLVLLR